jgi:hypothetical protein
MIDGIRPDVFLILWAIFFLTIALVNSCCIREERKIEDFEKHIDDEPPHTTCGIETNVKIDHNKEQ